MAYCPQQGNGKNGKITQGDAVRMPDGTKGTAEAFFGGSHTTVTVRTASGYTYSADTHTVERLSKES